MPEIRNKKPNPAPYPRFMDGRTILLLIASAILFTALLTWFFGGTVRSSFTVQGIINVRDDAVMVHQPEDAVVTDIMVKTNQFVKEGDTLLRVWPEQKGAAVSLDQMSAKAHDIPAPVSGYVTEITARQWERVDLTTTLARILQTPEPSLSFAMTFVTVDDIDKIEYGTEASIRLQGEGGETGVHLKGSVIDKTELPVSEYQMLVLTGSEMVARHFSKDNLDQYAVFVKLETDDGENPPAGIREQALICNEMCQITFFSEETHPWQLILNKR